MNYTFIIILSHVIVQKAIESFKNENTLHNSLYTSVKFCELYYLIRSKLSVHSLENYFSHHNKKNVMLLNTLFRIYYVIQKYSS